jgi:hypothetical protein
MATLNVIASRDAEVSTVSSVAAYPAYSARMEARMDQPLSRWLWLVKWILVKWWLLGLPHYLIVAVFLGGAWTTTSRAPGGLITLMTDRYPPFRLDMGEHEPGGPERGGA